MSENGTAKEGGVRGRKKLEFQVNETALRSAVFMETNAPEPTKLQRILKAIQGRETILKG